MVDSVPFRLLRVIGLGTFVLAAVVGSVWLSRVDTMMTAHPEPGGYTLPTPTLFPTQSPATALPQAVNTPTLAQPTATLEAGGAPSATAPVPPSETPTPEPVVCTLPMGWAIYIVRAGDTLYDLSRQSQTNLQALLQGNCLAAIRELDAGEAIYLPAVAQVTPTRAAPVCGAPAGWPIVIVKPGETLYALSVRYGTTVVALRRANCLSGDLVKAGDPLFVPPHIVVPPTAVRTASPTIVWWTPTPGVTGTPLPTAIPTASPTAPAPTETLPPTDTPTATVAPSPTPRPTETPVLVPTWTPPVWETPTEPPPTSTSEPTELLTATATP